MTLVLGWELVKCEKPDCNRQVKPSVKFCCAPCAVAAAGQHEIGEHSDGCEQRHAEHGDYRKEWEAL